MKVSCERRQASRTEIPFLLPLQNTLPPSCLTFSEIQGLIFPTLASPEIKLSFSFIPKLFFG